jgi:hypothetical protein
LIIILAAGRRCGIFSIVAGGGRTDIQSISDYLWMNEIVCFFPLYIKKDRAEQMTSSILLWW